MVDRLDVLRLFVRVVESGSFSAAAREAGLGQPAVSKQIAALEAHLGVRLLQRTSRSMALTETGRACYEAALRVVDDVEALQVLAGQGQAAPSGLIRVNAAPVFGRLHIVPRLGRFLARHPDIRIELSASTDRLNLIEEGLDLAIRHGTLDDRSLTARKLATVPFVTVATSAYLDAAGVPATPDDLERHACVIFSAGSGPQPWPFESAHGATVHHPAGRFRTSDGEQLRAAVLADLGLAHGPAWLFTPEIASGRVRVVLREYERALSDVSAIYPSQRRLPARVRCFIDFLADAFAADPSFSGKEAAH